MTNTVGYYSWKKWQLHFTIIRDDDLCSSFAPSVNTNIVLRKRGTMVKIMRKNKKFTMNRTRDQFIEGRRFARCRILTGSGTHDRPTWERPRCILNNISVYIFYKEGPEGIYVCTTNRDRGAIGRPAWTPRRRASFSFSFFSRRKSRSLSRNCHRRCCCCELSRLAIGKWLKRRRRCDDDDGESLDSASKE